MSKKFIFFIFIIIFLNSFSCNYSNVKKNSKKIKSENNIELKELKKGEEDLIIENSKSFLINLFNNNNEIDIFDNLFSLKWKNNFDKSSFKNLVNEWKSSFKNILYIIIKDLIKSEDYYKVYLECYHQNYITNFIIIWNKNKNIDYFSLQKFEYIEKEIKEPDYLKINLEIKETNYEIYNIKFIEYKNKFYDPKIIQSKMPVILLLNDISYDIKLGESVNFYNNLIKFFVSRNFIVLTYEINSNKKDIIKKNINYEFLLNLTSLLIEYINKNNKYLNKERVSILGFLSSNHYIPYILKILKYSKNTINLRGLILLNPYFFNITQLYKNYIYYLLNHDNYLTEYEENLINYINNLEDQEIFENELFFDKNLWKLLYETNIIEEINKLKTLFLVILSQKNILFNPENNNIISKNIEEDFNKILSSNSYLINKIIIPNLNIFFSKDINNPNIMNNATTIYPDIEFINLLNSYIKSLK